MNTTLALQPRDARLICKLLYSTLKREEDEIRRIGMSDARIDHHLCSVAFAPELVVGYLLRKEALIHRIPVECERQFADGGIVDACFIENGAYTALCEIKGPWGLWRTDREPLRKDVRKLLSHGFSEAASARRYNAWILVAEIQSAADLRQWVHEVVTGIAEIDEYEVSLPIPVNRTLDALTIWNGHRHDCLWVVVFSVRR
jgi:hypothetical protein